MRDWIIAFATEKFYVTEEDAHFYMKQVATGKRFVALKNGMMLSDRALYVIPAQTIEDSKKIESGKWKCNSGVWHSNEVICHCEEEMKIIDGAAVFVPKQAIKEYE